MGLAIPATAELAEDIIPADVRPSNCIREPRVGGRWDHRSLLPCRNAP